MVLYMVMPHVPVKVKRQGNGCIRFLLPAKGEFI